MSRLWLASMLVSLLLAPAGARAQQDSASEDGAARPELSEETRREALAHFERGGLAFERGDYDEAAQEFRAAYALTRHPDLLYNVYSAQERNGELVEAAEALEGYLRDGEPEPERRAALETRLERLRVRIAEAEAARRAQAEEAARREELAAERVREAEESAAREREQRLADARGGQTTSDGLQTSGWVVLGVGAASLVSFAVFGGLSLAEDASLASSCGRDAGRLCRADDVQDLDTYNLVADVSLYAGAGLVAVGAALVLIAEASRPSVEAAPSARVVPLVGPAGGGVAIGGRL